MADQHNDDVHKHYRLYLDDDWHCIAMANVREFHETEHEALSAARAHRAAVVESSPEVAALRARVAELETALAEATRSDPVWEQIDALARRVIATAPKPRDESVPPPDWSLHPCTVHGRPGLQVHRNDETGAVIDGLMLCAGDVVPRSEADAVTRALWAKYDAEHGYAPDEARIRADERAKCDLDAALAPAAPPDPAALATETPREKLRRDLDENAKRWASYPAEVRAAISTAEVFAVAPAEPAPDPWVLPEPLEWRHDTDGWYVTDGEYWLRLSYDNAGSVLRRRDDGDHLIDLIRRRNAAEPQGPA